MSGPSPRRRASRPLLAVLLLASVTAVTVDRQGGAASPFEPARDALGEVLGPVQEASAVVARPLREVPGFFTANRALRQDVARLEAQVDGLRGQLAATSDLRLRAAELDGLLRSSRETGLSLVPARVVAMGPAQSFSRTVTIDAGSDSGLDADMTVLNNDGLVGRVLRVTRTTATVLLLVDADSVVGGRIGSSMEVGFLHGRGGIGDDARLDLELVDEASVPARGDSVVTWGSEGGAPYVSGVPVGRVTTVYSSLRDTSQRAVIDPYVDFAALDLVGVVVPSGTVSDRAVIEADGGLR